MENSNGPGAPAMDQTWHWSMVDRRRRRSRDSSECEPTGIVGSKSSTREVQKGELTPGGPYRLLGWVVEGRSRAGDEEEQSAAVELDREATGARME
jgi:hypothetical protein